MNDNDALILIDLFSTTNGQRALTILEDRARSLVRIDQAPVPSAPSIPANGNSMGNPGYGGKPNAAFLNPNAALYRTGMEDQIYFIRRLIRKKEKNYGTKPITLEQIRPTL